MQFAIVALAQFKCKHSHRRTHTHTHLWQTRSRNNLVSQQQQQQQLRRRRCRLGQDGRRKMWQQLPTTAAATTTTATTTCNWPKNRKNDTHCRRVSALCLHSAPPRNAPPHPSNSNSSGSSLAWQLWTSFSSAPPPALSTPIDSRRW